MTETIVLSITFVAFLIVAFWKFFPSLIQRIDESVNAIKDHYSSLASKKNDLLQDLEKEQRRKLQIRTETQEFYIVAKDRIDALQSEYEVIIQNEIQKKKEQHQIMIEKLYEDYQKNVFDKVIFDSVAEVYKLLEKDTKYQNLIQKNVFSSLITQKEKLKQSFINASTL